MHIEDDEDSLGDDDELLGAIDDDLYSRIEATQRLDSLMKTAAIELRRPSKKPWIYLALGLVAAVLLGGAVALATRPASVFKNADAIETHIEKQPSAQAQFLYARLFNTEAHWMSVLQHYPGNQLYVRMAKRELALLYLQENDLDAASDIFNEFATLSDLEYSLRAFGLAGQCVVYSYEGKHKDALAKAIEVRSLSGKTPDGLHLDSRMERLFRHAYEASMKALNRKHNEQFDDWLKETTTHSQVS